MDDRRPDEPRYTAFLSYSHKDAAAAGRLHRRLETYRIPRRLVGAETARGPVPARLAPIFRDREELPAATDLSTTVREALARSGALIVLCSPAAAESLWVAEEIETFRKLHPDCPVLAAVLDGDPPDCFPPVLRAFGRDGTWHEPLATDLRRHRDGTRLGLLKLVAGITGVGLDALVQRDAARRIRRVMAVTGAALIAMLMLAAMTVIALDARRDAEHQRAQAEHQRAQAEGLVEYMLTDLRQGLKGVGRLDLMNNVNRRAMSYYEGQGPLENLSDDSLERRARILGAMGEDYENRGDFDRARARYEALYRATAALLANDPENPARILAHARSENRLALVATTRNRLAEARERFEAARRLLASISNWGRNQGEWQRLASYAEANSCVVMLRRGEDRSAALNRCHRAVFHSERLAALHPEDATAPYDLVFHLFWLAEAQHAAGQAVQARSTQARYLDLMSRMVASDPANMLWREQQVEVYIRQARFLRAQGEAGAATRCIEEAGIISRELAARDPLNARWSGFARQLSQTPARRNRNGHRRQHACQPFPHRGSEGR
jgi:tetratricopeptide (TPR) repeat protein